jgi:hypothetical protein
MSSLQQAVYDGTVVPAFKRDIQAVADERAQCYRHSNALEISSLVFMGIGMLVAFVATQEGLQFLGFVSGGSSILSVILRLLAKHAAREADERSRIYRDALTAVGLSPGAAVVPLGNDTLRDDSAAAPDAAASAGSGAATVV